MTKMSKTGPLIIGLTGSIAMGKSTVAAMLVEEGIPLFDADAEVYRLQGPKGAVLPAIETAFPGTTGPEGVLRQKLGAAVFGNPDQLKILEAIVHPAVAEARRQFLAEHDDAPMVVFDIPLLFEKGGYQGVDTIIVVSAPAPVQRARALAREGMTAEKFDHILTLQTPDAEKCARADHVIDTGTSLAETRAQVRALVKNLQQSH